MVKIITRRSVLLAGTATVAWTSVANAELLRSFAAGVSLSGPPLTPVIISSTTALATVGVPFNFHVIATNFPISYGATGLPSWATIDTSTGIISGTPDAAAVTNVTVSATNASGTGTGPLAITASMASGYSATVTLTNDDPTNVTVAGVPTKIYGWPFPPGAIPFGSVPQFTVSSVVQPFSMSPANACRYWPDGSLMFASFILRPTFGGIAANGGTQAVAVTSVAGAYPTSTRNYTTELYPNNLGVVAPISTYDSYEAGRTFASWLNVANTNNIRQVRTHLVGDAGDVYSFSVDMVESASPPTSTLAPHGLLTSQIYVHMLTYAPGGSGSPVLGGYRFWADVRQPYVDGPVSGFGGSHLSPVGNAAKDYRLFVPPNTTPANGFNYTVGGTAYTPPNWPFPLGGYSVTAGLNNTVSLQGSVAPQTFTGTVASTSNLGDYTVVNLTAPPTGAYVGMVVQGGPADGQLINNYDSGSIHVNTGFFLSPGATITATGGLLTVISGTQPTLGQYVTDTTGHLPVPVQVFGPVDFHAADPVILQQPGVPWTATIASEAMNGGTTYLAWSAQPPIIDGDSSPKMCAFYLQGGTFGGFADSSNTNYGGDGGPWWLAINGNGGHDPNGNNIFVGSMLNTSVSPANTSGSGTMLPAPMSQPGMRLAIGGTYGEWVFFQGNGSLSTDVPLRSGAVDQMAWSKSQVIPPFAVPGDPLYPTISQVNGGAEIYPYDGGSPNGGIGSQTGPGVYQYWPYCQGANDAGSGAWIVSGGIGQYLSGTPFWAGSDYYCGDYTSYFYGLMAALGFGCWLGDFSLSASSTVPVNTGNNQTPSGGTRSYLGMTTSVPLLSGSAGGFTGANGSGGWSWPGYTPPAARVQSLLCNSDGAHMAEFVSWAYLRTGRPELLDRLLAEVGFALETGGGGSGLSTNYTHLPGKNYYNAIIPPTLGQVRCGANRMRWVAWASLLYPSDPSGLNNTNYSSAGTFDGTHCDQYLLDTIDDNFQLIVDCVDPQYAEAYYPIPDNPGAIFAGAISGNTLTVDPFLVGTLAVGHCIKDANGNIPPNWFITALGSGSGGAGTYTVHEIVTGNIPNSATLSIATEAMFCGAGALVCNDKDLIIKNDNGFWWWPNTFCESVGLWTAAPLAVTAGSVAAANCIRNWATCSQAFADRRGGRINEWPYFFTTNGALSSLSGLDTELTAPFRTMSFPSGIGDGITSGQSFAVTPSPSSRAFTVAVGYSWNAVIANKDAVIPRNPPAPGQPSVPYFIIADWQDAGGGNFNLNLKNPDGSYFAPGAASGIWNDDSGAWYWRSNGFDGTNGTDGHNLTADPGGWLSYNTLKRIMFGWANAMVLAGTMADTPGGYIVNASNDLDARFAALETFSGITNYVGNAGWGYTYWAGVNIMSHF